MRVDGVKVFTVTKAHDREVLGEDISRWLRDHDHFELVAKEVVQSSDWEFHCISVVLFYKRRS